MKLTPALYSRLVDYEARQYLLDVFGSRIRFCSWAEGPTELWADGLVNIDGAEVLYFVDFADPPEGARHPSEVHAIREPLSRRRLQEYLDLKAHSESYIFDGEVHSLLLVVRAERSELEFDDDVLERARQHGFYVRRLHLKDDGTTLSLVDLDGTRWAHDRWDGLHPGEDTRGGLERILRAVGIDRSPYDDSRVIELFVRAVAEGNSTEYSQLLRVITGEMKSQAIRLLEQKAGDGDIVAMRSLAHLLQEEDRVRATEFLRVAADSGDAEALYELAVIAEGEDHDRALLLLEQAAESGDYLAMNNLAILLEPEDRSRALDLLETAAAAKEPWALCNLADEEQGEDRQRAIELNQEAVAAGCRSAKWSLAALIVDDDRSRARELLEQAADEDDSVALNRLANLSSEEDRSRAIELYARAICLGNDFAMRNLADFIVEEDRESAISLYELAIGHGNAGAMFQLGALIQEEDSERAVKLYEQAIALGDASATNRLARLIEEEDRQRAIELYEQAIELGNTNAMTNLAVLIRDDDRQRAIELLEQASEQDHPHALNWLGSLIQGEDPQRSAELYGRAAELGNTNAMTNLAILLVSEDRDRAIELFEQAVARDDSTAMNWLAYQIRDDDPQRAVELYERAIELGVTNAMVNLAELIVGANRERASELLARAASLGDSTAKDRLAKLQEKTRLRLNEATDGEAHRLEALCASVAETCADYRPCRIDKAAVWSWIQQFEQTTRLAVLSELDHVLQSTYWSEDRFRQFLRGVVVESEDDIADGDWRSVNFLRTQGAGESQTELLALLDDLLESEKGYSTRECGSKTGAFVYLDDGIFTGVKLQHEQGVGGWLKEAPSGSRLRILHPFMYDSGFSWAQRTIEQQARGRQVDIEFWYDVQYTCAWRNEAQGDILWPRTIPEDPEIMDALTVPDSTGSPFEPRGVTPAGASTVFSGEDGRNALEQALLAAGARLHATDAGMRPLGKVARRSPRSLGFGALTVTYRNCPNNAPLALWWGTDRRWSPLFERREGLEGPVVLGAEGFDVAF